MLELEDIKKLISLYNQIKRKDWSFSDIENIIKIYVDVIEEENRRDFEWCMDEDQRGIPRYDALDFDGICFEVNYRYHHQKKS